MNQGFEDFVPAPDEDDILSTCPLGCREWTEGFTLVGEIVQSRAFGQGVITEDNSLCITVAFEKKECRFAFPDAFEFCLRFEREEYQASIERFMARRARERRMFPSDGLLYDPIEDEDCYKAIADELDRAIKAKIGNHRFMGYCHLYWAEKKRILLEKYGIVWRSPSELNPTVLFD